MALYWVKSEEHGTEITPERSPCKEHRASIGEWVFITGLIFSNLMTNLYNTIWFAVVDILLSTKLKINSVSKGTDPEDSVFCHQLGVIGH